MKRTILAVVAVAVVAVGCNSQDAEPTTTTSTTTSTTTEPEASQCAEVVAMSEELQVEVDELLQRWDIVKLVDSPRRQEVLEELGSAATRQIYLVNDQPDCFPLEVRLDIADLEQMVNGLF